MTRISVDVYNADGERLGKGNAFVSTASSKRMLDGVGNFSFSHPAHDERAASLFAEERRVRIIIEQNGVKRELGRGIIRKRDYNAGPGSSTISVSGPDSLDELKRWNTLINRNYNNLPVSTIASSLVGRVPDWTCSSAVSTLMSSRFDGSSIMKALQDLIKLQGLHFRQTPGSNILEVGVFGDTAPVTLINTDRVTEGMDRNNNIALIDTIRHSISSEGVINRLYILGAGANVDSALTLAQSTRTTPYTIGTVLGFDRTNHYIEDAASIAAYGVIERMAQIKEIAPLSNNPTDVERASNAVYDAGVAQLVRYKDPQESYGITLKKCTQVIVPGDKVRLVYKDAIMRPDGTWSMPRNIDALFWVMSVSESVSGGTISTSLEIALIDRYEDSIAKTILGQLDQVRVQGAMVQPSINHYVYGPEQVQIDPTNPATTQLIVTDATFSIDRVLMRVRTQPFTSTATGAAAGGGTSTSTASGGASTQTSTATSHQHMILRSQDGTSVGTLALRTFTIIEQSTSNLFHFQAQADVGATAKFFDTQLDGSHTHDVAVPDHVHAFTIAAHAHAMLYGIYRDTVRPEGITITVNGVSVTPAPIGVAGSDLDTTIDITEEINGKVGGFQAVHDIVITCAASQGEVLISWDCYETITPFKFGA